MQKGAGRTQTPRRYLHPLPGGRMPPSTASREARGGDIGDGREHGHRLRFYSLLLGFPVACRGKLFRCWKRVSALFALPWAVSNRWRNSAAKPASAAKPDSSGCGVFALPVAQGYTIFRGDPNTRPTARPVAGWPPSAACGASIPVGAAKRFMPACASNIPAPGCPSHAPSPIGCGALAANARAGTRPDLAHDARAPR